MDVRRRRRERERGRHAREVVGFTAARDVDVAVAARVFDRFARPDAGVAVVGGCAGGKEVLRYEREVQRCTRGHEQHREVVADRTDFADQRFGAIEHAAEFLAAVAVFEDADPGSVEIPNRLLRVAQHFFG